MSGIFLKIIEREEERGREGVERIERRRGREERESVGKS